MTTRTPFHTFPTNVMELERGLRQLEATPATGTVTPDSFEEFPPNALIARAGAASGKPAYVGLTSGQFLVNRGGTLTGGTILDADIPDTIARDADATTAAAVAVAAHAGEPDPHPAYLTATEANAAYHPLTLALAMIYSGTGSPEGVVTAGMGALYLNLAGGAGTSLYVKESGSGTNTGWIAK